MRGRRGGAHVGLMTVVDEEFTAVRAALGNPPSIDGTEYYGHAPDERDVRPFILCQSSGRTNTPTQGSTTKLLERYRPSFVLLTGIAGGMRPDEVAPGDVVVPNYLHYCEFRKLDSGQRLPRYAPFDQPAGFLHARLHPIRHDDGWLDHLETERPAEGEPKIVVGSLVAGEKLLGDATSQEQQAIMDEYPDAAAVDMESYGFARAVFDARNYDRSYNPLHLVIRGVSDMVGSEANDEERRRWRNYAASTAAAVARALTDVLVAEARGELSAQGAAEGATDG